MAFQANNNLTVDGKAGPATQRVLYGTSAKSPVTYASLRMGDTGDAVRNLQYTLYELGSYDGAIDGVFGQTTSDSVRSFQIENNLQPVDGIAGNATQNYTVEIVEAPAITAPDILPGGVKDAPYSTTLTATGYPAPTWSTSDPLPPGGIRKNL